jgi:hypothetical protein
MDAILIAWPINVSPGSFASLRMRTLDFGLTPKKPANIEQTREIAGNQIAFDPKRKIGAEAYGE